jgi:hypothetical protein
MPRKIVARRSQIHGNGVFAAATIKKGEAPDRIQGQRRTHEEVDNGDTGDVDSGHTFLFTLNDEYVIDANHGGNTARWINHSCDPNCEAVLEETRARTAARTASSSSAARDQAGRRADLRLRHHPGRAAHRAPEEDLGLPLRFEEVHRDDAQAQAADRGLPDRASRAATRTCAMPGIGKRFA